jgi:hypothetical protein
MIDPIPSTAPWFGAAALVAIVAAGFTLSTRLRWRQLKIAAQLAATNAEGAAERLREPGPAADDIAIVPAGPFLLGIVPIPIGAWGQAAALMNGFFAHTDDLDAKVAGAVASLDQGRVLFEQRSSLALPGTVLAVLLVAFVGWRGKVYRAARSWRTTLVASGICLALALLFFHVAAPYRAENAMPWPAPVLGDKLRAEQPGTPALQGPDQIVRSPVFQLSAERAILDGYQVDWRELEDRLSTAKYNFRLLNPYTRFAGLWIVLCDGNVSTGEQARYLRAAYAAGYKQAQFAFSRRESMTRPILGELSRIYTTTARVDLIGDDDDVPADAVALADYATYEPLARKMVELRKADRTVSLRLPPINEAH